ncbi:MAG: ATP-binding cassette domain-containing protein [Candidatus Aminicenantaceae bacterium]
MRSDLLILEGVSLKREDRLILNNVNLKVKKGSIHSILGPNGAGKSSLAYLIIGCCDYLPDEGNIIFCNRNVNSMPIWEKAQMGLTLAWQEPARFEGLTVEDYLSLGMKEKNSDKIMEALEFVLLDPQKYLKREVDRTLSGGERKRIELASIFTMEPKLVILDEPDSGIDVLALENIVEMIKTLKKRGTTVLLITHREEISQIADRTSLMCSGLIVKEGTPEEIAQYYKTKCIPCPEKIFPADRNNTDKKKVSEKDARL